MKALALFSGGLDSVLAMYLIAKQDIEVIAVHIDMGFGPTSDRMEHMENMCKQIGVKFEILDLRKLYLDEVLFEPKYGYGKNFNPCIDCHGFMFRHTGKLLEHFDAQFMISGEVLGQRPMSQRKDALESVKKLSENDDLIIRPLSAKLMPPSKPEIEGWVDRDQLMDIQGRARHRQLTLAKEIGLKDFEAPGGGCLLTEIQFSKKLEDFIKYDTLDVDDIETLKVGRHLRLPDGAKLIIGRNKDENDKINATKSNKYLKARIVNATGPLCLVDKKASQDDLKLIANLILTYGKTEENTIYKVKLFDDVSEKYIEGTKYPSKDVAQQYLV